MLAVDQTDLAQRTSQKIEDAYHEHWLSSCPDGSYLFHAPEFYLKNGVARFINGRHRTLVLSKHLIEIPMALTNIDGYPVYAAHAHQSSLDVLAAMSVRKATEQEAFCFPDLPVRYLGYDHNISK